MSASKLPDTSQKRGTLVARPMVRADAHESVGTQETILGQEKVLAEIAHELGNFFHKLYYWSDYLKEKPGRSSEDSTAAQMLESTIRNLEGFLKVSLDYFHPTQLSFTRMPVTDLLDGVLFQVRQHLNGTPISVPADQSERGRLRKAAVMVDPGHLSRAFEVAVRHLTQRLGTESTVRLGIEESARRDCRGLEVGFHVQKPNEASPLFRTAEAGVEWAVAQKVVALHGGELLEQTQAHGGKDIVIFLPLCP
jgi:signal transduction histidine kinase